MYKMTNETMKFISMYIYYKLTIKLSNSQFAEYEWSSFQSVYSTFHISKFNNEGKPNLELQTRAFEYIARMHIFA